jgi:hypothetical protein
MGRTTHRLPHVYKKMVRHLCQQTTRCLVNLESDHCGDWKNMILCFFTQNSNFKPIFFLPKIPKKHLRDLVKSIYSHQKANKPQKKLKST